MAWPILIIYIIINIMVFGMYGIDKRKAIKNKWRIPESTLILGAALGVFGAALGMKVFHHKTQKLKFKIGVPVIMFFEVAIFTYMWIKFYVL